jgi:hypothetical protein
MLNRSKIVIVVEPFICALTFRINVMRQSRMPYSNRPFSDRVNYQQPTPSAAPRRTGPYPNGDVRDALVPKKTPLDVHRL